MYAVLQYDDVSSQKYESHSFYVRKLEIFAPTYLGLNFNTLTVDSSGDFVLRHLESIYHNILK